ncbi:PREDICTED: peroxiredoxin Q, chloroplastic-like [Vollenhovia emeryi]|uniref:peroxiredoxin Q, chloroplastic-like n=1 Tax=Vollenhovia emeryi TaxID=411798 RepID=UPI0005F3841B|nr:PREDICTED: peroxiredoxin Q, chloroplastic-like [Vollenhovia emeryi]
MEQSMELTVGNNVPYYYNTTEVVLMERDMELAVGNNVPYYYNTVKVLLMEQGMELAVGNNAPDFSLPTDSGENLSLNDTPGCRMEAKGFRDKIDDFSSFDTVIIGVSKDSVKRHANFKAKYSLPFSLVSDENAEMLEKYGVWVEKSMFGKKYMGIERTTFLIDKKGKVVKIWKNVKVSGHVDEVLEEVRRM